MTREGVGSEGAGSQGVGSQGVGSEGIGSEAVFLPRAKVPGCGYRVIVWGVCLRALICATWAVVLGAGLCLAPGVATAATYLVLPDGSGDFPTIEAAVQSVADGDVIELGEGVFTGAGNRNVSYLGKAITIRSQGDDPTACIIDCEASGRAFLFEGHEDTLSVLRGVTIRGGFVSGAYPENAGGAIYSDLSGPLIERCILRGCQADYGGGFASYRQVYPGPILRECTIVGNEAFVRGGGLDFYESHPRIEQTTLVGNAAPLGGAVGLNQNSQPQFSNCILAYSLTGEAVAGSGAEFACCNIYGNAYADWTGYEGQLGTSGNISEAPLFCDLAGEDYYLQDASPCAPGANPDCGLIGAYPVACETREAACCIGETCTLMLPADCDLAGGEFRPNELTCDPNPCGQVLLTVAPDGTGDYPTIQAAILAAEDGDIVELLDGTYTGEGNRDLDYYGKAITVRSQSGDPAACILDAEGTAEQPHHGVTFHYGVGPETVLEGVTITGAYDGAIRAYGASTFATVRECVIKNNQGVDTSGAICGGGGLRLVNCVFEQDAGYTGRALHMSDAATMEIQGCLFKNHSGDRGGAIYCRGSDPHFMDCHFESNQAFDGGGAIWFQEGCQAVLEQCSFTSNQAQVQGGALFFWEGTLELTGCEFQANTAQDAGGALGSWYGSVTMTGCEFRLNTSAHSGGAVRTDYAAVSLEDCLFEGNSAPNSGALRFSGPGAVQVGDCTFLGNHATTQGGAVAASYCGDLVDLSGCAFLDNTAGTGGGAVYNSESIMVLHQCTLGGNEAPEGSGIFTAGSYADLDLLNCLVTENLSGEGVGVAEDTWANLICCDLYGNEGGNWVGPIADLLGIQGNIEEDPLLCGEIVPEHPYMLQENSPCAEENNPQCQQIGAYGVGCTDTISGQSPESRLLASLRIAPVPFRGEGRIVYEVPAELAGRPVRLALYDASGRRVATLADHPHQPGTHSVAVGKQAPEGASLSSGIYFVRLSGEGLRLDRRLIVLE